MLENQFADTKGEYDKFNSFLVGKLDGRDQVEKKMYLLAISRKLFTHSLPLVVAEQCYDKLIRETRHLIISSKTDKKKDDSDNQDKQKETDKKDNKSDDKPADDGGGDIYQESWD